VHVTRRFTLNILICTGTVCAADRPMGTVCCTNSLDSTNKQLKLEFFSVNSVDSADVVVNFKFLILNYLIIGFCV
jgi:hypothetical protein